MNDKTIIKYSNCGSRECSWKEGKLIQKFMQKIYFQQRFETQQKGDKVRGGGNSKAML